ncbi:MAG: twin-arginine translocation signal domain-containing protein, partial [Pseudomonadota bacterium]
MTHSKITRRNLLRTSAAAGAGLSAPTLFTGAVWAQSGSGFTNAPEGGTVT